MSDIVHQLTQEGAGIRENDIACLSPYLKEAKPYQVKDARAFLEKIGVLP
jgi:hypothetical protein